MNKLTLCLMVPIAVLLTACGEPEIHLNSSHRDLPVVQVSVEPSLLLKRPVVESVSGTVRSKNETLVAAKVTGSIERIEVLVGQRVYKGDELLQLRADEIRQQRIQAEAQLSLANRDLKRTEELYERDASTETELDAVRTQQLIAQAAFDEAEVMEGYLTINAPFDGLISQRLVSEGDLATPGRALLEIQGLDELQLEASVPESLISRVYLDQEVRVESGNPVQVYAGKVVEVSPAADPVTRTFLVKVNLPQGEGLRSGQFARLLVEMDLREYVAVPETAVRQRGQMEQLFVMEDGVAKLRLVKLGRKRDGKVEILSGLAVGEQVVVSSESALRDGQPIRSES